MKRLSAILILIALALSAQQQLPRRPQSIFGTHGYNGPSLVPTSTTAICTVSASTSACSSTRTVYIIKIVLANESATADTCWIIDRQATPRSIYGSAAAPQSVSGTFIMSFYDQPAPGGISWGCTNGTVTGTVEYEY